MHYKIGKLYKTNNIGLSYSILQGVQFLLINREECKHGQCVVYNICNGYLVGIGKNPMHIGGDLMARRVNAFCGYCIDEEPLFEEVKDEHT